MKMHRKIITLILCISLLPLSAAYASIRDNTYLVFVWTSASSLLTPRWADQFEFDAGDVYRAYTTREGELTGTWIETPVGTSSWFQAYVEKSVETTTTTSTPEETPSGRSGSLVAPQQLKFDINIWGISYEVPLGLFNFSFILGYGAYLGADAVFLGVSTVPGIGGLAFFGSINPASGVQGDTLTVTIGGINTNFQTGETEVIWGDGIENVGTPDVDSTTELSQQIEIANDAPLGLTSVTVTYTGGSVTGVDVFEILEN
jgi:hypothetical protein